MRPDAKKSDLLYASDANLAEVDVYSYKTPNSRGLMGQLTGFEEPYGDCSDKLGNVYITDFEAADVVEYAKGGTTPIKTLTAAGSPIGCSVDPRTGDLAVSSYADADPSTGSGGVWVFVNGSGSPTLYADPNLEYYWSPGYDNKGNLFVEGISPNAPTLDELPSGGSSFVEITLSGATIDFPGGVMWDRKYVAASDQVYEGGYTTGIYRTTISGSGGTVVSSTALTDSCYTSGDNTDVPQPWIQGKKVIGGNNWCYFRFGYWNYARGGNPKKAINSDIAPNYPSGETVSR